MKTEKQRHPGETLARLSELLCHSWVLKEHEMVSNVGTEILLKLQQKNFGCCIAPKLTVSCLIRSHDCCRQVKTFNERTPRKIKI